MKKTFLILITICAIAGIANAQVSGGFKGPSATQNTNSTVKEALELGDDTNVTLTGKIINSLGDEKYTFKDTTGEVIIEIDDEDWNGIKVTPENTITINGEVDKEMFKPTKIDVETFSVNQ
ncbi:MAG: NirD/YgiW/YdeI family stress tolerance protein [Alphaproteobacteria bacterium]|nr:NirD/YgiW/YdeI family stress tolerance protein [Alphaproteobacteria bacterium]